MLLGGNIIFGGKRGGIPSGWVEVEWLKNAPSGSSGQYIDTGWFADRTKGFEVAIDFAVPTLDARRALLSDYGFNNANLSLEVDGLNRLRFYFEVGDRGLYGMGDKLKEWNTAHFRYSNGVCEVWPNNDSHIITQYSHQYDKSAVSARLFVDYLGRFSTFSNPVSIGKVTIKEGSVTIRDFVPVRNATTNEGAMCDILTGEIYRNAGTGAFVVGPDKAAWVNPYVTDGLVAMWDGEWNAGGGVHDPAATVWKNLVGENDLTLYTVGGRASWDDDALVCNQSNGWAAYGEGGPMYPLQMEVAVNIDRSKANDYNSIVGTSDKCHIGVLAQRSIKAIGSNGRTFSESFGNGPMAISASETGITLDGVGYGVQSGFSFAGAPRITVAGRQANEQVGRRFDGKIYCIRLYSRALTDAEIAANFAVDRARFNIA